MTFARFFGFAAFSLALYACGPSTFRLKGTSDDETAVVAKPVTIAFRARDVGAPTRSSERVTVELQLTVHPPNKPAVTIPAKTISEVEKIETILAATASGPSKVKVAYEEAHMDRTIGGRRKDLPSPLAGHTYVLHVVGAKLVAEHADGTAPSVQETKLLSLAYRIVAQPKAQGQKGNAEAHFIDRTSDAPTAIEVGARAAVFEDELRTMLGAGPASDMKVEDIEVTLLGVPEGATNEAVFQVGVTTDADVDDPNPLHMHTLLRGRWIVRTDSGWTRRFLLGGPTSISGSGPNGTVDGTGMMRIEASYEYGEAHAAT